jgi:hypothetical protein
MIEICRGLDSDDIFHRRMTLLFIVQEVIHYRGTKGRKSEVERKSVPSFTGRGRKLRQSGPPTLLEDHRLKTTVQVLDRRTAVLSCPRASCSVSRGVSVRR